VSCWVVALMSQMRRCGEALLRELLTDKKVPRPADIFAFL
jgi:hypothetical protein